MPLVGIVLALVLLVALIGTGLLSLTWLLRVLVLLLARLRLLGTIVSHELTFRWVRLRTNNWKGQAFRRGKKSPAEAGPVLGDSEGAQIILEVPEPLCDRCQ